MIRGRSPNSVGDGALIRLGTEPYLRPGRSPDFWDVIRERQSQRSVNFPIDDREIGEPLFGLRPRKNSGSVPDGNRAPSPKL